MHSSKQTKALEFQKLKNESDTAQDEIHDPRVVAFSKVCYKVMNRSNEKKEKENCDIRGYFELEKQRANKLQVIVHAEYHVLGTKIRFFPLFVSMCHRP